MQPFRIRIALKKPCQKGVGINAKVGLEAETVFVGWFGFWLGFFGLVSVLLPVPPLFFFLNQ